MEFDFKYDGVEYSIGVDIRWFRGSQYEVDHITEMVRFDVENEEWIEMSVARQSEELVDAAYKAIHEELSKYGGLL